MDMKPTGITGDSLKSTYMMKTENGNMKLHHMRSAVVTQIQG